jgi:hypothetical protein
MRAQTISDEQDSTILDSGLRASDGLDDADATFKTCRGMIEVLGVQAVLARDNGVKTLRIKRILGEKFYVVSPTLPVVLSRTTK